MREILFGPPGTGKTTTLLGMVEDELERGTPPDRISYVSFTTRAANEAIDRAAQKFKLNKSDLPYFRTLHSLCFRALGMKSADVLEGKKLRAFGDLIGIEVSEFVSLEEGSSFGFKKGDRILFMENLARVRGVSLRVQYDASDDDLSWWEVERVSRALERYKAENNMYDYTDMLAMFVERGYQPQIDVLFVDEAQDLSPLQWRVVAKLAATARRVIIAGDDDQAIYRWSGADVNHLINMEGTARVLEQSWRIPRAVQRLADSIIQRVRNRRPKLWNPRDEEGQVDWLADFSEVDLGSPTSTLVLARNNFLFKTVEKQIRESGYLYEHRGRRSIDNDTIDAVFSWTRLTRGQSVTLPEARNIYQHMSSGARIKRGYKTLPRLNDDEQLTLQDLQDRGGLVIGSVPWMEALDLVNPFDREYLRAIVRRNQGKYPDKVNLRISTIHGMKGGEANRVVLLTDMAQRTHSEYYDNPEDEYRVWYVAVTRTRQHLQIIKPRTSRFFEFAG